MNDDIKEILDDLLFTTTLPNVSIKLNKEKLNQLLDYTTNLQHTEDLYNQLLKDYDKLQQRIEYLERSNNRREDTIMGLRDEIVEYEDYKSRCEKAVEKLKKIQQNAIKYGAEHDAVVCQELIDGLNGKER